MTTRMPPPPDPPASKAPPPGRWRRTPSCASARTALPPSSASTTRWGKATPRASHRSLPTNSTPTGRSFAPSTHRRIRSATPTSSSVRFKAPAAAPPSRNPDLMSRKVPASEIRTSKSVLSHASGKSAGYGAMAEAASRVKLATEPVLKTRDQFVYIGKDKATPRVDSPSKCNGSAVYTIDVKLPGLLTAVIAWPPSFGAKLLSFDASDAKKIKGVTDVVQVPEGVAVVATGTWAALQGRRALIAQWDESSSRSLDSDQLLASYKAQATQPGKPFAKPTQGPAPAAKTVEAVYEFPFLAHASMEPMNCVAWLHDGMLETWSGHQFPTFDHQFAAKAAGLPIDKVTLHTLVSAGSFGRRANCWSDFTVAAVHVAKAIDGRAPVRLQYTREDDTGAGLYRPMYVHSVKASIA